MNICTGTMDQLKAPKGEWCFVDIGFAQSKNKSCGYLVATVGSDSDGRPQNLNYGELGERLTELAGSGGDPLHLVIEAPVSAGFDAKGNPVGRSIEKHNTDHRYWYEGLGTSVLLATLYLFRRLIDADPAREVRIFEGFVSFKNSDEPSDHMADVEALKRVV